LSDTDQVERDGSGPVIERVSGDRGTAHLSGPGAHNETAPAFTDGPVAGRRERCDLRAAFRKASAPAIVVRDDVRSLEFAAGLDAGIAVAVGRHVVRFEA